MNDVKQRRRSGLEKEMPQCRWCGFGMGPKSSLPRDDRNTGRWRFRAATAIQVKDSSGSGNITLRTTGVVAAIGHYWDHRTRNRGRRVSFRYLTTSGVGQESGAPFGQDRKGSRSGSNSRLTRMRPAGRNPSPGLRISC